MQSLGVHYSSAFRNRIETGHVRVNTAGMFSAGDKEDEVHIHAPGKIELKIASVDPGVGQATWISDSRMDRLKRMFGVL